MRTVYIDECGFTGADLMNREQPIFVVASNNFDASEAAALKTRFFADFQGSELKHSRLGKTPRGQAMVVAFLETLNQFDRIAISIAEKRFTTLVKFVDLVVEVGMHADGLNLYKDGGNIALSNMWNAVLSLDTKLYDEVCGAFQRFVRLPNRTTAAALVAILERGHPVEIIREELSNMLVSLRRLSSDYVSRLDGADLDIAAALALPIAVRWKSRIGVGFEVVHDQSSNMARSKWLWDLMTSPTAPPATVGNGAWSESYPIGVTKTEFARSDTTVSLQIADVLAGAAARWAAWKAGLRDGDTYAQTLDAFFMKLGESNGVATMLWPSLDVSRHPTPSGVADPIEYTTELIRAAQER